MNTKNKKILISALCIAMVGSVGYGLANVQTANAEYLASSLTMDSGASIYLGDVSGIRYSYKTAYAEDTNYGMLIVPEDYLLKSGIEISANTDYVTALQASTYLTEKEKGQIIIEENLVPDGYDKDNLPTAGTNVTFKHAIGELYTQNYDRRFFGIGFIKNGDSYTYAENNDNVRSIMYVASAALNDYAFDYDNLEEEYKTSYAKNLTTLGTHVTTGISNVTGAFEYSVVGETEMTVGDTQTLTVDNARQNNRQADLAVYWTSGDEALATVENGEVTAIGAGAVSITAKTTADGVNTTYQDDITINVKQDPVTLFNGMVSSLDSENPDYATMETAYNLYGTMTAAQQEEVATNYQTLWNLIPKTFNDNALVDYSSALAVAYNANGAYYGNNTEDDTREDESADGATLGIRKINDSALAFASEKSAYADDASVLKITGTAAYANGSALLDGVDWEAVMYFHEVVNNADYANKKIGFYMKANTVASNTRYFDTASAINFDTGDQKKISNENWQFCTYDVSADGTLYVRLQNHVKNSLSLGGQLEMYLTSIYEVSAPYVNELIGLYNAETDDAKKAQYQTKILDFYNALSEEEQANVNLPGLFTAYVNGLSTTSTDDELIVGLNLYRSMSETDQATVATSYETLQGLIESRLDSTAFVDYSSALAIAYNANFGLYGRVQSDSSVVKVDSLSKNIACTPYTDTSVTFDEEGFEPHLKVVGVTAQWHVSGGAEYEGTTYSGAVMLVALPVVTKETTIAFYANTSANSYVGVVTESKRFSSVTTAATDGSVEEKLTANTSGKITATLQANTQYYLRIRTLVSGSSSKFQVTGMHTRLSSIYKVTAEA